jgi:hypothetical protein
VEIPLTSDHPLVTLSVVSLYQSNICTIDAKMYPELALSLLHIIYLSGNFHSFCHLHEETIIQQAGFKNNMYLAFAFIVAIVGTSCTLAFALLGYEDYINHNAPNLCQPLSGTSKDYALETLGSNSVYHFFRGGRICGWFIVLDTIAVQFWLLFALVRGSAMDLSDDKVDM